MTRTCSSPRCCGRSRPWGSQGATGPSPGGSAPGRSAALRGVRRRQGPGHDRDRAPTPSRDPAGLAGATRGAVGWGGAAAGRGAGALGEGPGIVLRGQGHAAPDRGVGRRPPPPGRAHQAPARGLDRRRGDPGDPAAGPFRGHLRRHRPGHGEGATELASGRLHRGDAERLAAPTPSFTIDTYQHVLPGMQAQAARVFEQLVAPGALPADQRSEKSERTREKRRKKTAEAQADQFSGLGFFVAGTGFEPVTSGL